MVYFFNLHEVAYFWIKKVLRTTIKKRIPKMTEITIIVFL